MTPPSAAFATSTLDIDEVARFDAVADQFWSSKGPFTLLHRLNDVRLPFIQTCGDLKEKVTLDIGCGGGILAEAMARQGAIVTGIDLSPKAIEIAREHAAKNNLTIDYQTVDCASLIESHSGAFDLITCMEVLEHVPNPASLIAIARKLLAPNGVLVVSTINRTLQAWIKMIGVAEHLLGWVPVGTHCYKKFIKPSELDRACRKAGLTCTARVGMEYQLFKKMFYQTPGPGTHYLAAYREVCCID